MSSLHTGHFMINRIICYVKANMARERERERGDKKKWRQRREEHDWGVKALVWHWQITRVAYNCGTQFGLPELNHLLHSLLAVTMSHLYFTAVFFSAKHLPPSVTTIIIYYWRGCVSLPEVHVSWYSVFIKDLIWTLTPL